MELSKLTITPLDKRGQPMTNKEVRGAFQPEHLLDQQDRQRGIPSVLVRPEPAPAPTAW
jgi:hypothetical protein